MVVTSTAFAEGGDIPTHFTCEGEDVSPPLAWTDPPEGTKSIALIADDPDAPKKTFGHWVLYNLPPATRDLPEGTKVTPSGPTAPSGALTGDNDFGHNAYGGPCPPSGRHRYVFKVYALDTKLPNLGKIRAENLERAMDGHVIGRGQLIGTYQKGQGPRT
jgi:Raf kinase inhibitor-like YbhB/YbcL family protein